MAKVERIATEYASGSLFGVDYGSKVRVVMRSPDAVMWVGYGVNIAKRDHKGFPPRKVADSAKLASLMLPNVQKTIDEFFGEGAGQAALLTCGVRGQGTVLFNGGGKQLLLPGPAFRAKIYAAYDSVAPDVKLPPQGQKICLQCEKPLRLKTIHHQFPTSPQEGQPTTLEQCSRLTNYPIIAIHGYGTTKPEEWWPYVSWFETWDGESYLDDTFCSDHCAATYGRRAAQELAHLKAGGQPVKQEWTPREDVAHFDRDEEAKRSREEIERWFGQRISPDIKT